MRESQFAEPEAIKHPHEISTICAELEKLGRCSEVFSELTVEACNQAAYVLKRMRLIGFSKAPDSRIVEAIKDMLAKQGDG
jgi:hypothetical protein